ncbi:ABC transporter substrate-binding protein [Pelagibius sp. Alg239-R121]|uniref:substrate-binding periplasmic protein n=1 Tax=Pelagibius sp. Alg239-R121 TaxID=2993448 RepID=UPI0024A7A025|nr:transporter substrate-binding domain-containing protein [Pelagibius sp. Alg239-R121]
MIWSSRKALWCVCVLLMSTTAHAEQLTFTTGDWRPYIFEENGTVDPKMSGFSVEIVNSVFANLGHQVIYKTAPFLRQIQEVERGKFTALVGVYQEEAPNLVFPKEPIGMTRNCFYTKPEQTWQYENLKSLPSVRFATISGYVYGEIDDYVEANDERVIKLTGRESEMMMRLTELVDIDRVAAFVQDVAVAEYFFKIKGLEGRYKKAGCLPFIETMIGFSPKDPRTADFVPEFDIQVAKLRDSGEMERILNKYGVTDWK